MPLSIIDRRAHTDSDDLANGRPSCERMKIHLFIQEKKPPGPFNRFHNRWGNLNETPRLRIAAEESLSTASCLAASGGLHEA